MDTEGIPVKLARTVSGNDLTTELCGAAVDCGYETENDPEMMIVPGSVIYVPMNHMVKITVPLGKNFFWERFAVIRCGKTEDICDPHFDDYNNRMTIDAEGQHELVRFKAKLKKKSNRKCLVILGICGVVPLLLWGFIRNLDIETEVDSTTHRRYEEIRPHLDNIVSKLNDRLSADPTPS